MPRGARLLCLPGAGVYRCALIAHREPRRILVAEDDDDIRGGLAELLAEAGYAVSVAANGADGLREARAARPDLILLDLSMPVLDGLAFLTARREDPALSGVPVVVVTARQGVSLPECCATILKPFDVDALLDVVSRCLPPGAAAPLATA